MAGETRITAPKVMAELQSHLQRHEDKLDGKIHDTWHAVFGDRGKGGLCSDVEEMKRGYKTMKAIGVAVKPAPGPAGIKTVNGVAIANVKTINGVAIANVKSVQGLT